MSEKENILITGCSSGIGATTALFLAEKGYSVTATMRQIHQESEELQRLHSLPNVLLLPLDVTDKDSITEAVESSISHFGRLDVLINNAGYAEVGLLSELSTEQAREQFETNLFGVIEMIHGVLPHFKERKRGLILNVSSIVGEVAMPFYSLYVSSKFALNGLSLSLAYELAHWNIGVSLIAPGGTKTRFGQNVVTKPNQESDEITKNLYRAFENSMYRRKSTLNAPPSVVSHVIWRVIRRGSKRNYRRVRFSLLYTGRDAKLLHLLNRWIPNPLLIHFTNRFFDLSQKSHQHRE